MTMSISSDPELFFLTRVACTQTDRQTLVSYPDSVLERAELPIFNVALHPVAGCSDVI